MVAKGIRNIVGGILAAGLSMLPHSCYRPEVYDTVNNRRNVLTEIMADRPQVELDSINNTIHNNPPSLASVELQRKIDSVAFQDMFKGSQLAQDSNFVKEYNNMMAKTQVPIVEGTRGSFFYDYQKMEGTLHKMVTVKEMKKLSKNPVMRGLGKEKYTDAGMQYIIDSVAHGKLLEKFGALDSVRAKQFREICAKIRP